MQMLLISHIAVLLVCGIAHMGYLSSAFRTTVVRSSSMHLKNRIRIPGRILYMGSRGDACGIEHDSMRVVRLSTHLTNTTLRPPPPPAFFLPSLDGAGVYAPSAMTNLSLAYDVFKLVVAPEDRSAFVEVAAFVISALKTFDRPVLLIGDSFGGLLATYIASRERALVSTLVLVNPATSFPRTAWSALAPALVQAGPLYPLLGPAVLGASIVQPAQLWRMGGKVLGDVLRANTREATLDMLRAVMTDYLARIPAGTAEWRITRWLHNGNVLMRARFANITTPTLVLIGSADRLLPSYSEGYRLERLLSSAAVEVREFAAGGHALLDDTLDLLAVLTQSRTLGPPRVSPSLDVSLPSPAEVAAAEGVASGFLAAFSPVFLQAGADGQLRRGVSSVPVGRAGRPVLLVGNHQLYGLDTGLLVREFLREHEVLLRGLGHPMLFDGSAPQPPLLPSSDDSGNELFTPENFRKVSPLSIYELMRRNETILLFPGGANELCHGKGEAYTLKWSQQSDFVRMAASFGALVVPFGAIGVDDSLSIVLDGEEISALPILGDRANKFASRLPRARATVPEKFVYPLVVPRTPRRIYFLFQQAYDTRRLNARDKQACKAAYQEIQASVEDSIETLKRFRQADPFDSYLPRRALYEAITGKPAPTAPLSSFMVTSQGQASK